MMKPGEMIPLEMLEFLAQKRRITSFSSGADFDGHALLLKFAIEDGSALTVHIAAPLARDILGRGEHAAKHFKWVDQRPKMPPHLKRFYAERPDVGPEDWQGRASDGRPHTAQAHQLDTFGNGMIWTMWFSADRPTLIWIDPEFMFELMDLIDGMLTRGDLKG
ncbi:hypothetical protein ACFSM5_17645 [Lacibacterium aquatile]|uniref:Uncharacterized protein n=1 Tax=Lacibacterium aquatile TaxID=1168082 RepID=A0ABW5DUD4_9PROT